MKQKIQKLIDSKIKESIDGHNADYLFTHFYNGLPDKLKEYTSEMTKEELEMMLIDKLIEEIGFRCEINGLEANLGI